MQNLNLRTRSPDLTSLRDTPCLYLITPKDGSVRPTRKPLCETVGRPPTVPRTHFEVPLEPSVGGILRNPLTERLNQFDLSGVLRMIHL